MSSKDSENPGLLVSPKPGQNPVTFDPAGGAAKGIMVVDRKLDTVTYCNVLI